MKRTRCGDFKNAPKISLTLFAFVVRISVCVIDRENREDMAQGRGRFLLCRRATALFSLTFRTRARSRTGAETIYACDNNRHTLSPARTLPSFRCSVRECVCVCVRGLSIFPPSTRFQSMVRGEKRDEKERERFRRISFMLCCRELSLFSLSLSSSRLAQRKSILLFL